MADERVHEEALGPVVDFGRRASLLDVAAIHDDDPVGERLRLFLIVGDDDRGDAEGALQADEFELQLDAQGAIER
ncbi:MAG: hypothetical protein KDJ41_20020, partial [Hyphomicrobiaceae bacterium]|nr:hypothetical protein [Hyphomicrobiaceae bacterium]